MYYQDGPAEKLRPDSFSRQTDAAIFRSELEDSEVSWEENSKEKEEPTVSVPNETQNSTMEIDVSVSVRDETQTPNSKEKGEPTVSVPNETQLGQLQDLDNEIDDIASLNEEADIDVSVSVPEETQTPSGQLQDLDNDMAEFASLNSKEKEEPTVSVPNETQLGQLQDLDNEMAEIASLNEEADIDASVSVPEETQTPTGEFLDIDMDVDLSDIPLLNSTECEEPENHVNLQSVFNEIDNAQLSHVNIEDFLNDTTIDVDEGSSQPLVNESASRPLHDITNTMTKKPVRNIYPLEDCIHQEAVRLSYDKNLYIFPYQKSLLDSKNANGKIKYLLGIYFKRGQLSRCTYRGSKNKAALDPAVTDSIVEYIRSVHPDTPSFMIGKAITDKCLRAERAERELCRSVNT